MRWDAHRDKAQMETYGKSPDTNRFESKDLEQLVQRKQSLCHLMATSAEGSMYRTDWMQYERVVGRSDPFSEIGHLATPPADLIGYETTLCESCGCARA